MAFTLWNILGFVDLRKVGQKECLRLSSFTVHRTGSVRVSGQLK